MEIVSLTSPITRGSEANLEALTLPGERCALKVTLPSGAVSGSKGTKTEPVAGEDGIVSWTWRVGSRTTPGVGSVKVTCGLDGGSVETTADFVVRAKED